jgi:hypothetical protein
VVALTVVPAIGANDAVEYSERYWASVGILFGTGIVIGVPAYHLSSHWHTVYVPTRPVPEP